MIVVPEVSRTGARFVAAVAGRSAPRELKWHYGEEQHEQESAHRRQAAGASQVVHELKHWANVFGACKAVL
ncbi:hypothetical protein APY03_1634 [Variovorax sp. WDL1]|nr:hypothetical protein APY03_1634 [Variovorax sp. WDL1]